MSKQLPILIIFVVGAFLIVSPFVIQVSMAQTQAETFLIRLVGAVGQSGLVNIGISVNNVAVLNNVEMLKNSPITVTAKCP